MKRVTRVPDARQPEEEILESEPRSDAELISAVRGGDLEAYGHLFERHVEAARRLARQLVPGPDADDLVSDAFAKVLGVLQGGGGPDLSFRAYLLTAIRRLHIDRIRSGSKLHSTDDMTPFDQGVPFTDTAVAGFENATAAKAFASLPERWQQVLWHTEVEGQKPAEVAPLLGMSANSVSALAYRAREGLREAFVSMHAQNAGEDVCALTRSNLGSYIRGGCSRRDAAKVEGHLQGCLECTAIYLELTEVNANLGAVLAPLLLGTAGAGYLAAAHLGAAAAAKGGVVLAFGRARDWVLHQPAGRATSGVGVAAAAVVAVAIGLNLSSGPDPRREANVTAPAPQSSTAADPTPATAPAAPGSPAATPPTLTAPVRQPITPTQVLAPTPGVTAPAPVTGNGVDAAVTVTPLGTVQVPAGSTSVTIDLAAGVDHPAGTTVTVRSARIQGSTPHGQVVIGSGAARLASAVAARSSIATITYTPDASWRGTETIRYVLSDGEGSRATGTVRVSTPNRGPVATADHIELHAVYAATPPITLNLTGNDTDANRDPLTIVGLTPALGGGGSVALVKGQVRYTRPVRTSAQVTDRTDTFTYTVSDGHGGTDTARVSVVSGLNPNAVPVAPGNQVSTHWSTPVSLALHATDADGDAITYTVTDGTHGAVTVSNGVATYTPTGAYAGTDTFSYTASDGHGSATGTITVTLTNAHPAAGDETPIALSDTQTATITVPSTDADGDLLTISGVYGADRNGNTLTWEPTFGIDTTHTISYTLSDGASSVAVSVPVTSTRPSGTVSLSTSHPATTTSAEKHHLAIAGLPSGRIVQVTIVLTNGGVRDQQVGEGGAVEDGRHCTESESGASIAITCNVSADGDFYHLDFNPGATWDLSVSATPVDFTGPIATFHRSS